MFKCFAFENKPLALRKRFDIVFEGVGKKTCAIGFMSIKA